MILRPRVVVDVKQKKKSKNSRPPLGERFEFLEDALPGRREALLAAQFEVVDTASGRERSLKLWRKTGTSADEDLRQLWLHEMRQVQRVMSYAGAHEVIVDILEFVEDEEEFGILLEHGGQPLELKSQRASRQHWLKNLGAPRPRSLLWRNIKRLVEAIGIIHSQGLVHGKLSAASVMTDGSDDPDFKLTGFEWSLWLSADTTGRAQAKLGPKGGTAREDRYSFAEDWRALGRLIASYLDTSISASGEIRPNHHVSTPIALSASEVALLRRLVYPSRLDHLEAMSISRSIDDIVVEVSRSSTSRSGTYILCFTQGSGLGEAVYDETEGEIASDDYHGQLDWVRADLDCGPRLLAPRVFDAVTARLSLVTETMVYTLVPMREDGSVAWDVAMCMRVERRGEGFRIGETDEHDVRQPIEVVTSVRRAIDTRARLGSDALDWSGYAGSSVSQPATDRGSLIRQALVLVQVIESVINALEIYPVEILAVEIQGSNRYVILRAEPDSERDKIAKRVGLTESERALKRLFEEDQRDSEGRWRLSMAASLGASRRNDVAVSFAETQDHQGRHAYRFEMDDDLPEGGPWFLRPERDAGTEGQVTRRLKNVKALIDRVDLADMLDDPWRVRRSSKDGFDDRQKKDKRFLELDESKQSAMYGLWGTLPSYFVVGPPGVGKTYLATEIIRRRFETDRSSRLLLTAQGHDALDHLQRKAKTVLVDGGFSDLIVVRSATPERPASDEDVHRTASDLLRILSESPLTKDAPAPIRDRIHDLARASARLASSKVALAKIERTALNAVSSLILDAADIVISTANSPDIERLVEAREQFDWVIVEEAAKAIGPELVGPLMLSGRRLLIGDHHQLPPFGADRLGKVLQNQGLVAEAIGLAEQYIGPLLRDGEVADLVAIAEDATMLRSCADMALRLLEPFRTVVVEDERRKKVNAFHRTISSTLTEQRRMDPSIAHIVSEAFYDGKLTTTQKRIAESDNELAPFEVQQSLPASPVVVVDFDHVSTTASRSSAEVRRPRFHNPKEVDAVSEVLRRVRARSGLEKPPSLVILSFYKAQVVKLSERIDAEIRNGPLTHLAGFVPATGGKWISTVDGFQGNEADLVILSLVRNNAGAGASALGFLRDRRRMNVALSRAKSKLVIVGSLTFLREAVRGVNPDEDDHDLSFLTRVDEAIIELSKEKRADGTAKATILTPAALKAESV
jgi:hypothetical protein